MPGDIFKHVAPGTTEPGFPAVIRNGIVDIMRGSMVSTGEDTPRIAHNNTIIPVVNNTGGDLVQFAVVGLHTATYAPDVDAQAAAFAQTRCMSAVTPEYDNGHATRFGIVQEPIISGATGLCAVAGFTPVMLAVAKSWHNYAVPVDGSVDNMRSAPYGSAIVHWASGGEGGAADWALVGIKSAIPTVVLGYASTNWHKLTGDGSWVDVYPCADFYHTGVDTVNTIRVLLPRNGLDEDPNVEAGDVLTCMMLDPETDPPTAVGISNYLDGKIDVSLQLIVSGEAAPRGWSVMDAYDGKTIMFNTDTNKPSGYDWHGNTENNHDSHFATSAGRQSGIFQTLDAIDGGEYATHSDTSNWPPYQVIEVAKRIDNSA